MKEGFCMTVRRFFSVLALIVVLATTFVAGRATADQPHMQAALEHLRLAKVELDAALADKGGHRAKAIGLTKDAIAQVERGIEVDRRESPEAQGAGGRSQVHLRPAPCALPPLLLQNCFHRLPSESEPKLFVAGRVGISGDKSPLDRVQFMLTETIDVFTESRLPLQERV